MTIELLTLAAMLISAVVAVLGGVFALMAFYAKRLENRLDKRIAGVETSLSDFRSEVDARFEKVDKQFEKVDKQFEKVDKQFEKVDKQLAQLNREIQKNAVAIARIEGPRPKLYVR